MGHRAQLRLAIVTWIEWTYQRRRRQRALGKLTPIEFELPIARAEATDGVQTDSDRRHVRRYEAVAGAFETSRIRRAI